LKSNNIKTVTHFLQSLENTNIIPQLNQQIKQLENTEQWSEEEHTVLESIDISLTSTLTDLEKKLRPTSTPWSPLLALAYDTLKFWKIQKMSANNKIQMGETLEQLYAKHKEKLFQGNPNRSIYGKFLRPRKRY
jgi:hypothetical protein